MLFYTLLNAEIICTMPVPNILYSAILTYFVRVIKNISLFYFDEFVGVVFVIGVALPANNVLLTSIV